LKIFEVSYSFSSSERLSSTITLPCSTVMPATSAPVAAAAVFSICEV
jgi:hypothetical protein